MYSHRLEYGPTLSCPILPEPSISPASHKLLSLCIVITSISSSLPTLDCKLHEGRNWVLLSVYTGIWHLVYTWRMFDERKGRKGRKRKGRKEGRKEERKKGRREGWREGGKDGWTLKIEAKLSVTHNRSWTVLKIFHFDLFRFGTLPLILTRKEVSLSLTFFSPRTTCVSNIWFTKNVWHMLSLVAIDATGK